MTDYFSLKDRSIHQYFVPLGMGQSEFYVLYISHNLYKVGEIFGFGEVGGGGGGGGGG